ncbi:hypothetical protein [Jutongia sp.]|jgi:hypothetical protein|uniref:hypothetical protein n=1 Tax=Jutongia sp. TaxID=2944204 RepID=UPI0003387090|nr:unknown [Clostridium sp. CAG:277]
MKLKKTKKSILTVTWMVNEGNFDVMIGSYETRKDANDVGDFVSDVLNKLLNSGCIKDYTVTVCGDNPQ